MTGCVRRLLQRFLVMPVPPDADDDLIAALSADMASPGVHFEALRHLAARVVRALADMPSSTTSTQSLLTRAGEASAIGTAHDEAAALARSQALMIEGMTLALAAAVSAPSPPASASTDELITMLVAVDELFASGEHDRARREFGGVATRALRSPDAVAAWPYRLPRGGSLEVRGWSGGLGLLLSARSDLPGIGRAGSG